jgi:hypothetical protein
MSPLLLFLAIAAPSAPDLGAYSVEPWNSPDQGAFLELLDSAASRGQRLVIQGVRRDSADRIAILDTTVLTNIPGGFRMEQSRHDFEENMLSRQTSWYTRDGMLVDSGSESRWIMGALVSQSFASTSRVGTSRRSLLSSWERSTYTDGTSSLFRDTIIAERDGSGRLLVESDCYSWIMSSLEDGPDTSGSCMTDSIVWEGGIPKAWKESITSRGSSSRTFHHLSWNGTRLVSDSAVVMIPGSSALDSVRVLRCDWRDSLLRSCSENGREIVSMEWDRWGHPVRRVSFLDEEEDQWTRDSLGRSLVHRLRYLRSSIVLVDSSVYVSGPWPARQFHFACDALSGACDLESSREFSVSFLDPIGIHSGRHRSHLRAFRRGEELFLSGLPGESGEIRIRDASGGLVSASTWKGSSTSVPLPVRSGILLWSAHAADGTLLGSGSLPNLR